MFVTCSQIITYICMCVYTHIFTQIKSITELWKRGETYIAFPYPFPNIFLGLPTLWESEMVDHL